MQVRLGHSGPKHSVIVEIRGAMARSLPGLCTSTHLNTAGPILTDAMAEENAKMTDCYYEKKDWRACKDEVCQVPGSQLGD